MLVLKAGANIHAYFCIHNMESKKIFFGDSNRRNLS